MNAPISCLVSNAIHIAFGYLERSGELRNPEIAAEIMLDTIEALIRRGERRQLMLANRAIEAYQRYRAEQRTITVVADMSDR
jgi:hypothetical protein